MTITFAERQARARRLNILRCLSKAHDGRLTNHDLLLEMDLYEASRLSLDDVRMLLEWLDERSAVSLQHVGPVIRAEISKRGWEHLERRGEPIEGIDRPSRV